jgi:ring-1,2-phenylacetyl-CoA epoxidase subunit PaaD
MAVVTGTVVPDRAAGWAVAAAVPDPELPMVTIGDLGILRDVTVSGAEVTATVTPTYSGCPAMREIADDLRDRLARAGFDRVTVRHQIAPPWSTEWITDDGRRKLAEHGIAPPRPATGGPVRLNLTSRPGQVRDVACPHCGSARTVQTAAFSGTACKALYRCESCSEPFENVKPF